LTNTFGSPRASHRRVVEILSKGALWNQVAFLEKFVSTITIVLAHGALVKRSFLQEYRASYRTGEEQLCTSESNDIERTNRKMSSVKWIILMLFGLFAVRAFADAFPKLNTKSEVEFWKDGKMLESIDSILFITTIGANGSMIDTLYIDKAFQGADKNRLWEHNGMIRVDLRTRIDSYRIHLLHNNREYVSDQLEFKGTKRFFRFLLMDDGTLENDHPLFYARWKKYLISLAITVILELLLALILLRSANVRP